MEQDFAALHNAVLAHFLSTGETLPIFKWQDLVQWRMSSTVEALWPILQRFAYGHSSTAPAQPKPSALGTLLHLKPPTASKLDPNTYPRESIDASLAALGPLQPLAWYNLAVLHTARNHYRTALKICDELLELLFPPLCELHHALAVKLGLLFLFLTVKLSFSTHPKLSTVLADMEKVISHRLSHTLGVGTSTFYFRFQNLLLLTLGFFYTSISYPIRRTYYLFGAKCLVLYSSRAIIHDPSQNQIKQT